ncbi:hypothetical protein ACFUOZ_15910 [Paenarthrobacter sp. NPDC057355]|uniref:hypothetical protein n=1 Tax=Paenarthrobacter sp. NPDC057355 TaxID=3346105 RepID=UPI003635CEAB
MPIVSVRWRSKVLAMVVGMVLMLSGCGVSKMGGQDGKPRPGERSAQEVFTDFMDAVDDTVQKSGADWPIWNRSHTAGFFPGPCSVRSRDDGRAYQTQIEGGPVEDPQASVDAMKAYWESKGYKITHVFDNRGDNTTGIEIHAVTPRGMLLNFTPTKTVSFVKVVGECTLDPAADRRTT